MTSDKRRRQIIRLQKELGYYWSLSPARQLSWSPRALRTLGVRVIRKGIHEARKVKRVAEFIDDVKGYLYTRQPLTPKKKTAFQEHPTYDVSIIIPAYNKLTYTLACLSSLANNISDGIAYQVIVIDNASSDDTPAALAKIAGLTYIRNEENMGFVDACNQGAKLAGGAYLVFLNNDTRVETGWLENLLETIKRPGVGLVGSKLVYPDRHLQEAGSIIFNDGSGYNYGKKEWPWSYKYNYVREVDYCSGASVIIAKKLFDELGGFDRLYAPAYYEDTDLAFAVRQSGRKVLYQPKSVLYHIEGGTAGTDLSSGYKKYQAINKVKFEKKWSEQLRQQHSPNELYLARDRSADKLALILDENIPKPDEDSGSVRMFRLVEILTELGYKVTFYAYNPTYYQKYAEPLQQQGVEVVYGPGNVRDWLKDNGQYYDLVMLSRARIAAFFMDFCQRYCTKAKLIYDTVDLHYLRLARAAEYEPHAKQLADVAKKHELVEKYLIEEADLTLVVSPIEKQLLNKDGYKKVEIVSNIHEIDEPAYELGFNDRKDLLFVGGYGHPPNIDGIRWFVHDIFPLIRAKLPEVALNVVGSHMPAEFRTELSAQPGVVVHGFVEDLTPLLKATRVFVAPLRYGAGVKGKIGQAVEYGIPVVSTTIGVEGMGLTDQQSCLIADTAQSFADQTIQLYQDEAQWQRLQTAARQVLVDGFSKDTTAAQLKRILAEL